MLWQKMTSLEPISRYGVKQVFSVHLGLLNKGKRLFGEKKLTVPLGCIMKDCACTQDYKLSLPK